MTMIFSLPRFKWMNRIKSNFLRLQGASIGADIIWYPKVWVVPGRNLRIGNSVNVSREVLISSEGGVTIGNNCQIGYRTQIYSSNHELNGEVLSESGNIYKPVFIGNNVWIGASTIILPGVIIGNNVVVGAGSVVTRNIPDNSIYGGNPAKSLRN